MVSGARVSLAVLTDGFSSPGPGAYGGDAIAAIFKAREKANAKGKRYRKRRSFDVARIQRLAKPSRITPKTVDVTLQRSKSLKSLVDRSKTKKRKLKRENTVKTQSAPKSEIDVLPMILKIYKLVGHLEESVDSKFNHLTRLQSQISRLQLDVEGIRSSIDVQTEQRLSQSARSSFRARRSFGAQSNASQSPGDSNSSHLTQHSEPQSRRSPRVSKEDVRSFWKDLDSDNKEAMECIREVSTPLDSSISVSHHETRQTWTEGSDVQVFSHSLEEWCPGRIVREFVDVETGVEMFEVAYHNASKKLTKDMTRDSEFIRQIEEEKLSSTTAQKPTVRVRALPSIRYVALMSIVFALMAFFVVRVGLVSESADPSEDPL